MYLIDTYNLVHAAIPMGGQFSSITVRSLCQFIISSPARPKVTLILDGRPKPDEPSENEFPDLHLVYSGAGVSADKVIGQLIERAPHRKKITVVTNDRAIILHARRLSANAISCEQFLHNLLGNHAAARRTARSQLPPHKTNGTSSTGETDHWLKEFGLTPPPPISNLQSQFSNPADPDSLSNDEIERLMGGPPDTP